MVPNENCNRNPLNLFKWKKNSFEQVSGVAVTVSVWNHVILHVVLQTHVAKTNNSAKQEDCSLWVTFIWFSYDIMIIIITKKSMFGSLVKLVATCSKLHFCKVTSEITQNGQLSNCNRDPLHLFKWTNLLDSSSRDHKK